jgi:fucokinase
VAAWLSCDRLSLQALLGAADPSEELKNRHTLERSVQQGLVASLQRTTIGPAVATAARFVTRKKLGPLARRALPWRVTVKAPARVDLAGGWSDTPPLSYEAGGAVVNLGVLVDGARPIEASCAVEALELEGTPIEASAVPGAPPPPPRRAPLVLSTGGGVVSRGNAGSSSAGVTTVEVWGLEDLRDFCDPLAPCALLKAALVCAGVVTLPPRDGTSGGAGESLEAQLAQSVGGRLVVTTRSALPQGSGLGTSSILAGALLAALGHAAMRPYDDDDDGGGGGGGGVDNSGGCGGGGASSLVHAVLVLEQMLTTGGGWQDQVGGCGPFPATLATSAPTLPLRVASRNVPLPPLLSRALSLEGSGGGGGGDDASGGHLVLVFTGAPRLAKNLLVEVLRNWWAGGGARDTGADDGADDGAAAAGVGGGGGGDVGATISALKAGARDCAGFLEAGDLEGVGRCLSNYHGLKRAMAGPSYDCAPAVSRLVDRLRPLALGLSLCGAGGGGFLAVITRGPCRPGTHAWAQVAEAAAACGGTVHRAGLARGGMQVVFGV